MSAMILVLIPCRDKKEADRIGLALVKKRLAVCSGFIPKMSSVYWWPPRAKRLERGKNEVMVLAETRRDKLPAIERKVKRLHSYELPCILAIPLAAANKGYREWLNGEL